MAMAVAVARQLAVVGGDLLPSTDRPTDHCWVMPEGRTFRRTESGFSRFPSEAHGGS